MAGLEGPKASDNPTIPPVISSPLRILLLSPPDTPPPSFLDGPSHHSISTPYYTASIPIWRAPLPLTPSAITVFRTEWTSPEAAEVIRAIGAWVFCFKKPRNEGDLENLRLALSTIHGVVDQHGGGRYMGDVAQFLAVGMKRSGSGVGVGVGIGGVEMGMEELEDFCRGERGWEWVDGEVGEGEGDEDGDGEGGRNEFREKIGISRLKEALEAHEWESGDGDALSISDEFNLGSEEDGFGAEVGQMEREMMGLKMAIKGEGDEGNEGDGEDEDVGVEELERMMLKVRAIRDMGGAMPEGERRRFAKKALGDVLRGL